MLPALLAGMGGNAGAAGPDYGDTITNSLLLDSTASQYLSRTFGTPTLSAVFTMSLWCKRGKLATGSYQSWIGTNSVSTLVGFGNSADTIIHDMTNTFVNSSAVFRDPAQWAHFVYNYSGTTYTIYENNTQVLTGTATNSQFNIASMLTLIGAFYSPAVLGFLDALIANVIFVDGQALSPSSFGRVSSDTGAWVNKNYSGTYGNNGFKLTFSNSAALGEDSSGNGNNWTLNGGITSANQRTDSPTTNYCALNPLHKGATVVLSDGNLKAAPSSGAAAAYSTFKLSTGKVYAEAVFPGAFGTIGGGWGFTSSDTPISAYPGATAGLWWCYDSAVNFFINNQTTSNSYANRVVTGATFRWAIDFDAGKAWLGVNADWLDSTNGNTGDPATGANPTFTFTPNISLYLLVYSTQATSVWNTNFGQKTLSYSAPSGFSVINSVNMATPGVPKSTDAFVQVYEAAASVVSSLETARAAFTTSIDIYKLYGNEAWKVRFSDDNTNMLAFNSNAGKAAWSAPSTGTYHGVSIRCGASYGVVTGTYSGNDSANRNIAHSLGASIGAAIVKNESTGDWYFWHKGMTGQTYFQTLNGTAAQSATNTPWGTGNFSATDFMVTNNATNNLNASGATYRYILFADIEGYLKVTTQLGNAAADGTFSARGHRPALSIEKPLTGTANGYVFSSKMTADYNPSAAYHLLENTQSAAATGVDMVSNGVKHRSATVGNAAVTYSVISFAEQPFKTANAR